MLDYYSEEFDDLFDLPVLYVPITEKESTEEEEDDDKGLDCKVEKDTRPLFGFSPCKSATLINESNNDLELTGLDKGLGVDVPLVNEDID